MFLQLSPIRWRQHTRSGAGENAANKRNTTDRDAGSGNGAANFSSSSPQATHCVSFAVSLEEYSVETFGKAAQTAYCAATAESLDVKSSQVRR